MANSKYDWDTVNWSLTTKEIAIALGADHTTVLYHRKKRADYRPRDGWKPEDFIATNAELALASGKTRASVARARIKYAPETHTPKAKRITATAWKWVDWSLTTTQIAKALGCSKGRVSQARAKYAPHTVRHR